MTDSQEILRILTAIKLIDTLQYLLLFAIILLLLFKK
jgi:hypothetical protein